MRQGGSCKTDHAKNRVPGIRDLRKVREREAVQRNGPDARTRRSDGVGAQCKSKERDSVGIAATAIGLLVKL